MKNSKTNVPDRHDNEFSIERHNNDSSGARHTNAATGILNIENVDRYGHASGEHIRAYTGEDLLTGRTLKNNLRDLSKTGPADRGGPGKAAEIASKKKQNVEKIIQRDPKRVEQTDDVIKVNHEETDHVEVCTDGSVTHRSQMKFGKDADSTLDLLRDKGDARPEQKLDDYLKSNDAIDVPSDQVSDVKKQLSEEAAVLRRNGHRKKAEQIEELREKVRDGRLTRDDAKRYHDDPFWETAKDVLETAHDAGLKGAGVGMAVGGAVASLQNIYEVYAHNKDPEQAVTDGLKSVAAAGGSGYAIGFLGTGIKGLMENAPSEAIRAVSKTSLPTLIVSTGFTLSSSVKGYALGDIGHEQFLNQVGEAGSSLLGSSAMASAGQIVIPVPVLGGVIGGLLGHTLTTTFYAESVAALQKQQESADRLQRIRYECEIARRAAIEERKELQQFFARTNNHIDTHIRRYFDDIDDSIAKGDSDSLASRVNDFAKELGCTLHLGSFSEFEEFMSQDTPLRL